MSDGYFHGQADDPMVRFRTETLDGKPVYLMQVNSAIAASVRKPSAL